MQMLAAGGIPCAGTHPSFEDDRAGPQQAIDREWFETLRGQAVKVLDPHINIIPDNVPVRVVWLNRRPSEQAVSITKMMVLVAGMPKPNSTRRNRLLDAVIKDTRVTKAALPAGPALYLDFEIILARPLAAAEKLAQFLGDAFTVNVPAMAAVVRPRQPQCAPDMSMEVSLMQEAGHA
ncbi:hypothetical protein [Dyella sp.]|uniref:hypothetical protein n=1 Tax=Dyella sp. TaxID=1869338 RepID=UPI002FDA879C